MSLQVEVDNQLIVALQQEIGALNDEVEALRDQNLHLRNSQRVARTVIRGLRDKLNELQQTAQENDEEFLALCQSDIEIVEEVVPGGEGGLPDATGYSGSAA